MKLSPAQFAAAERGGCRFSPASSAEVQRLSMQNRIFWYDGQPFTARSATGFQETAGTLSKLIARHEQPTPEAASLDPVPLLSPLPLVEATAPKDLDSAAAAPRDQEIPPPAPADKPDAPAGQPAHAPVGDAPEQPTARTGRRRDPASQKSGNIPAILADKAPTAVAATTSDLLQTRGRHTFPLALSIAAAQTAGTQIAGEDFVLLVERVHRTLLAL